jgi:hypothetical protein
MMSNPARKLSIDGEEAEGLPELDGEAFLREFHRRMAQAGMPVRVASAGPDWEPAITLNIPADEASAMLVRMRRGEA